MCSARQATASRVAEPCLLKDLALPPDWQKWAIFRLNDEMGSQALRNLFEASGQFRFSIYSDETPYVVADLRHGETPDLSTVCDWRRVCVRPQWNPQFPVLFASLPPAAKSYDLKPSPRDSHKSCRVRGSRPTCNLRPGGGRQDKPGWSAGKRRTNRKLFNRLRPFIRTAVTFLFPSKATPAQLKQCNNWLMNFVESKGLPTRCVWEGPGPHIHAALGIVHDPALELEWRRSFASLYLRVFAVPMEEKSFHWKAEENPDKIASYCLKTRKKGIMVKGAFDWLIFTPYWERNFKMICSLDLRERG